MAKVRFKICKVQLRDELSGQMWELTEYPYLQTSGFLLSPLYRYGSSLSSLLLVLLNTTKRNQYFSMAFLHCKREPMRYQHIKYIQYDCRANKVRVNTQLTHQASWTLFQDKEEKTKLEDQRISTPYSCLVWAPASQITIYTQQQDAICKDMKLSYPELALNFFFSI